MPDNYIGSSCLSVDSEVSLAKSILDYNLETVSFLYITFAQEKLKNLNFHFGIFPVIFPVAFSFVIISDVFLTRIPSKIDLPQLLVFTNFQLDTKKSVKLNKPIHRNHRREKTSLLSLLAIT